MIYTDIYKTYTGNVEDFKLIARLTFETQEEAEAYLDSRFDITQDSLGGYNNSGDMYANLHGVKTVYTVVDKTNYDVHTAYASIEGYKYTKADLVQLVNNELATYEEINNDPVGSRVRYTATDYVDDIINTLDDEFDFVVNSITVD